MRARAARPGPFGPSATPPPLPLDCFGCLTCAVSFLVFASDCFGYLVTTSLLLYQDFGSEPSATAPAAANRAELQMFLRVLWGCGGAVLLILVAAWAYFAYRTPRADDAGAAAGPCAGLHHASVSVGVTERRCKVAAASSVDVLPERGA